MAEFIVITPRVEGSTESGFGTVYYSDRIRLPSVELAMRHGMVDLDRADDFLIGQVDGNALVGLQWMEERRSDRGELVNVALQLGLVVR